MRLILTGTEEQQGEKGLTASKVVMSTQLYAKDSIQIDVSIKSSVKWGAVPLLYPHLLLLSGREDPQSQAAERRLNLSYTPGRPIPHQQHE